MKLNTLRNRNGFDSTYDVREDIRNRLILNLRETELSNERLYTIMETIFRDTFIEYMDKSLDKDVFFTHKMNNLTSFTIDGESYLPPKFNDDQEHFIDSTTDFICNGVKKLSDHIQKEDRSIIFYSLGTLIRAADAKTFTPKLIWKAKFFIGE